MRKPFLTVYLDPKLLDALEAYAKMRGTPKSTVAEAAIAGFLTPDAADQKEAAVARRLDRMDRRLARLERDLGIAVEMLALFIRFWLIATPALPDAAQAAARAKGRERYAGFIDALGRRLAGGRAFAREVAEDLQSNSPGEDGPHEEARTRD